MTLVIMFSFEIMNSLQNGVATHFRVTALLSEQDCQRHCSIVASLTLMLSVYEPLVSRLASRKIANIRSDTLSEQCCLNSSVRVRVRVSCSSSKFRPVSIYLQLLVYIVYLFIHIFRGKLRPVAISRSTLVYAYGTMRPNSNSN